MDFFGMDLPGILSVLALAVLIAVFFIVRKDKSYDSIGPVSMSALKKKSGGPENRQHPRLYINWPITLDTSLGKLKATLSNISAGGAFIACGEPLPLYEQFTMIIDSKGSDLIINAEVLWSNVNVADDMIQNRGMGIRFVHNTDEVREFLNTTINQKLVEKEDSGVQPEAQPVS
jgi:hypothetical protein